MVLATDAGLFVRDRAGRGRYAGECPGWYPVVIGDRVYCHAHGAIRSRPLADPTAAWEKWGEAPVLRPGEKDWQLFVAGGRLYLAAQLHAHYSRPLDDLKAGWERRYPIPLWPNGLAEAGTKLFGNDHKQLFARPAADPQAAWVQAGPWPDFACDTLVADGDRLLAFGGPGPIYARPVAAAADEPWVVVGRVHDPYKR